MRRIAKVGHCVRDFFDRRIHALRSGDPPDPSVEAGQLRVLMALLVESRVVVPADWQMPGVPLSQRGLAIDRLRAESLSLVRSRVMDPLLPLKLVERRILHSFAQMIADVVVEMACLAMTQETLLASMVAPAAKVRRGGPPSGPFVDLVAKSALHSDPRGFLEDAEERHRLAALDISRARRRMFYLASERADSVAKGVGSKEFPLPAPLETPGALASVSAIRGIDNDMFLDLDTAASAASSLPASSVSVPV